VYLRHAEVNGKASVFPIISLHRVELAPMVRAVLPFSSGRSRLKDSWLILMACKELR